MSSHLQCHRRFTFGLTVYQLGLTFKQQHGTQRSAQLQGRHRRVAVPLLRTEITQLSLRLASEGRHYYDLSLGLAALIASWIPVPSASQTEQVLCT